MWIRVLQKAFFIVILPRGPLLAPYSEIQTNKIGWLQIKRAFNEGAPIRDRCPVSSSKSNLSLKNRILPNPFMKFVRYIIIYQNIPPGGPAMFWAPAFSSIGRSFF